MRKSDYITRDINGSEALPRMYRHSATLLILASQALFLALSPFTPDYHETLRIRVVEDADNAELLSKWRRTCHMMRKH